MNLDEAISFLGALRKDLIPKGLLSYAEATQLGIEALTFKQWWDKEGAHIEPYLLPGETKD